MRLARSVAPRSVLGDDVKYLRLLLTLIQEVGLESLLGEGRYVALQVTDDEAIMRNRQLSTKRFHELGHLSTGALDTRRWLPISDFYHDNSKSIYFSAYEPRSAQGEQLPVAATRLLWDPDIRINDLRTPVEQMHPAVAGLLQSVKPGAIAEIGGLVKVPGICSVATLALFREVFFFAGHRGIDYLVAGLEPRVWPYYKVLFGEAILMLHDRGSTVHPPGAHGDKLGVIIDTRHAERIYRRKFSRSSREIDWLNEKVGVSVSAHNTEPDSVCPRHQVTVTMLRSILRAYFRNRLLPSS